MKILLRKCSSGHNNLFEWTTVTSRRWYKINYKKIVAVHNGDADPFKAYQPFRIAMDKMRMFPRFYVSVFEGSYDRTTKILRVKKL